ncbi:MAG TPA: hypothetical protein VJS64_18130 [Pyrinomonadaceae bacterium]|nr:hypothetical protein [Pyrinomonadaceae bacterium]
MVRHSIWTLAVVVLLAASSVGSAQDNKKKKSSKFETLVDQLTEQVDKQLQDRNKQLASLNELYQKLDKLELQVLDERTEIARRNAISREALLTSDEMIRDPKNKARVTELAAFLRRSITRDQDLFDRSLRHAETIRFQHERQIAKIKSDQTVLKNIRRDLERLKAFPTDKERASFFLNTVKSFLDGLSSLPGI